MGLAARSPQGFEGAAPTPREDHWFPAPPERAAATERVARAPGSSWEANALAATTNEAKQAPRTASAATFMKLPCNEAVACGWAARDRRSAAGHPCDARMRKETGSSAGAVASDSNPRDGADHCRKACSYGTAVTTAAIGGADAVAAPGRKDGAKPGEEPRTIAACAGRRDAGTAGRTASADSRAVAVARAGSGGGFAAPESEKWAGRVAGAGEAAPSTRRVAGPFERCAIRASCGAEGIHSPTQHESRQVR